MSLSKVLEQIEKIKPVALEDVDSGPVETMTARRGRKRNAEEQLKLLRMQYTQDLLRSAVFILVTGGNREEFVNIATANTDYGAFKADPETFYRDLANRIAPALYEGKESVANLFDVLGRHLEDKANELGVLEYPQLRFKAEYNKTINNKEEFVQLVKTAINEQVGGELVGVQSVLSITDQAIDTGHKASVTPVLLSTGDEKLALDLVEALNRLTPRVFLVVTGKATRAMKSVEDAVLVKEANEESVASALTTIRGSLKK
jgi:hypothetical protein